MARVTSTPGIGRIAVGSFIGTAIEFYDFYIYGTATALVLNSTFFPTLAPVNATLAAFATFAVAFIGRPLGSVVFGHFGDRVGRKATLVASLLTMGLSTVAIGLLPGYATLGVAARCCWCCCASSRASASAASGAAPHCWPWRTRPPAAGLVRDLPSARAVDRLLRRQRTVPRPVRAASDDAFHAWGWRIPFLASAVLVAVGLVVRLRLAETPVFAEVVRRREQSRMPLVDMLRKAPVRLLLGGGTIITCYVIFYVTTTFCLSYVTTTLKMPRSEALGLLIAAIWAMALTTVLSCLAGDRFGRKPVLITGCVATGGHRPGHVPAARGRHRAVGRHRVRAGPCRHGLGVRAARRLPAGAVRRALPVLGVVVRVQLGRRARRCVGPDHRGRAGRRLRHDRRRLVRRGLGRRQPAVPARSPRDPALFHRTSARVGA